MTKSVLAAVALVALSSAFGMQGGKQPVWTSGAKVAPVSVGQAPNSSAFGTRVYFAGQPTEADFAEYAKLGVKTVVNLRMPAEMEKVGFDEARAAKAAGMSYVAVPLGATMPTDGDLARIYAELNKSGNQKVLLHCASSNRAGMAWTLFRGQQHGVPAVDALSEGKAAGMKSPALEKVAKEKLGVQR